MKMNSNLHIAVFPWLAYGHFLPYLHLSNKLAEKGNEVSFLLPKGVVTKLAKLNKFPHLIHFLPLTIPSVDGLPPGAETLSDIPIPLESQLCAAMDQTQDQVRTILGTIMPDYMFFDFSFWVPALCRELGLKSVMYCIACAALPALGSAPCDKIGGVTFEEIMKESTFNPSAEFGCGGVSFAERFRIGKEESDALAIRTCYEIEAPFVDQLLQHSAKPVLLTGPLLLDNDQAPLEEKWENWLNKFSAGYVVFCAFGSQTVLQKSQFQELLLGFELSGRPFLVALSPPSECSTMEEALPDGFAERVKERGLVCGGWVPQAHILNHPSVGCFVSHGGSSSMWESLASNCQIILVPPKFDHVVHTMLMVKQLQVAVEVKKEVNRWISKESLSNAIISAMREDSEVAMTMKSNHAKWRRFVLDKDIQETYLNTFIKNLHDLLQKNRIF